MSVVPDHAVVVSTTHVALGCAINAQGQQVCSGPSAGLWATFGVYLLLYLAIGVLSIIATVSVVGKAGYSRWWVLITFVPLVGTIFIFVFAFSTWPVTTEVQMLRARLGERSAYGGSRGSAGFGTGLGQPTYGVPGSASPYAATPDQSPAAQSPLPTFGSFIAEGKVSVVTPPGVSQPSPTPAPGLPPAGWYQNPQDAQGQLRYWDGSNWTDQVQ